MVEVREEAFEGRVEGGGGGAVINYAMLNGKLPWGALLDGK